MRLCPAVCLRAFLLLALLLPWPARAEEPAPIRIGSVAALTKGAVFTLAYLDGVRMAVEDLNKAGGILGRPVELVSRDSKGDPGEAVRLAEELRTRDKADLLINADFSQATLALNNWALQNRVPVVVTASEADTVIWEGGNDYVVRVIPGGNAWIGATLRKAVETYGDALKGKRWVVVAPHIEFGHALAKAAREKAEAMGLDARWVGEQWPAYGKMNAGATLAALDKEKPDVVLCLLFDTDLARFIREGRARGFFYDSSAIGFKNKDRVFIAPALGMPEMMEQIGPELPHGWIVIGYPVAPDGKPLLKTPRVEKLAAFMGDYAKRTGKKPRFYAASGYAGVKLIAAALSRAGSTDPDAVRKAFKELAFDSPYGPLAVRGLDNQANAPLWAGVTFHAYGADGAPDLLGLKNPGEYLTNDFAPPEAWIRKNRPRLNDAP